MPARTKKSKAALQREDQKKSDSKNATVKVLSSTSQSKVLQDKEKTAVCTVISGTLHQGDLRFQHPGVQCTYISFWALVMMENKQPLFWNADDIDSCIVDGNARFLEHCFKNNIQPRQLLVKELPQSLKVSNNCLVKLRQLDSDIKVGTLDQNISKSESTSIFTAIEEAIVSCFDLFDSCFLVCGGQTMAIAKRQNIFFVFDSHSRGKDGFLHHAGSAVLLHFTDIQVLISFIKQLFIESLCIAITEQFELIPVTFSKQSNGKEMGSETGSCIMNTGLNTETQTSCKELNISSVNDPAKSATSAMSSFSPLKNENTSSFEGDMHSNVVETKIQSHKLNSLKHVARKEYMRSYMAMRRNDDSFRNESKALSLKSMKKLLSTETGRQRHNEKAAESRQNMVSTEEGRKMRNEQSAERMRKSISSVEGKRKHQDRSAEGMKKMLSTEEARQKHRKRSAEGMAKMLSTDEARQKHRKRTAEGMAKLLSTEEARQKHRKRSAEGMKKMLSTEEARQKHRKRSAEGMAKMLSTKDGKQKHKKRSAEGMKKMLSTEDGKQKHKKRSAEGMKKMLSTEDGKQKHKKRSAEGMKKMLSTEDGKQKHKKRSAEGMKKMLSTEDGKQKHKKRSAEGMKKMLSTEDGKQKHKKRSAEGMKKMLSTEEGKQKHNKRSTEGMKKNRGTEAGRQYNRIKALTAMRKLRANEEFKELERMQKRQKRLDNLGNLKQKESFKKNKRRKSREYAENEHLVRKKRKIGLSFPDAINKFEDAVCQSVSYVCSCCHQTWFKHSVREVSSLNNISALNKTLLQECVTGFLSVANREWICSTCIYNIRRDKVPKLAVINGMKFPDRPPELNLNNLEERLISLRIPFMQIRALNSGGQFSLKGSVVNVPAEIEPTIRALPRLQHQSETIPVKLKRMKEFKSAVVTENVRPVAVMAALQTLLKSSELYIEANISLNDAWNNDDKAKREIEGEPIEESSGDESDAFNETNDDENVLLMTLLDE